jgi:phospholipid transport system substrate-binding protein
LRSALILIAVLSAPRMSPTDVLKARDAEVRALLPKPGEELTPAQREKIESVLIKTVDLEGMAKAALGKHWDEQPPAKRKKFMDAFVARFKRLTGDQIPSYRESQTQFLPERKEGDKVIVPTVLVVKGEPTHVDYVMRPAKDSWRIGDIIIDDVSTVENYRSSFSKVIAQEGFDALIAKLSKKS